MKKLLRHKWKGSDNPNDLKMQCQICGVIRYWDFAYRHTMYQWGTKLTYNAPDCKLHTEKPYNPIEVQPVKK